MSRSAWAFCKLSNFLCYHVKGKEQAGQGKDLCITFHLEFDSSARPSHSVVRETFKIMTLYKRDQIVSKSTRRVL